MAEALYPKGPPPSYESQFHYYDDHTRRTELSPVPSAPPPPHHDPRIPQSRSGFQTMSGGGGGGGDHQLSPHKNKKTPPTAQKRTAAASGKVKLSTSPHGRVPKRLPPPPPPPSSTRNPRLKLPRQRPQSSIHLGSQDAYLLSSNGQYRCDQSYRPQELSRSNYLSSSLHNIAEPSAYDGDQVPVASIHQNVIADARGVSSVGHHPTIPLYECIDPMESSMLEECPEHVQCPKSGDYSYRRQASAPPMMHRQQQHRVSLPPPETYETSRSDHQNQYHPISGFPQPSLSQHPILESSHDCYPESNVEILPVVAQTSFQAPLQPPHQHPQQQQVLSLAASLPPPHHQHQHPPQQQVPSLAASLPPPHHQHQHSPQQQVPSLAASLPPPHHQHQHPPQQQVPSQALSDQPTLNKQLSKPQPKPRSSSLPLNKMAGVASGPPPQIATQPFPLMATAAAPDSSLPQQTSQQISSNQVVTSFSGQTQVQSYSFTQQSSVITYPGLVMAAPVAQPPGILKMPSSLQPPHPIGFQFVSSDQQNLVNEPEVLKANGVSVVLNERGSNSAQEEGIRNELNDGSSNVTARPSEHRESELQPHVALSTLEDVGSKEGTRTQENIEASSHGGKIQQQNDVEAKGIGRTLIENEADSQSQPRESQVQPRTLTEKGVEVQPRTPTERGTEGQVMSRTPRTGTQEGQNQPRTPTERSTEDQSEPRTPNRRPVPKPRKMKRRDSGMETSDSDAPQIRGREMDRAISERSRSVCMEGLETEGEESPALMRSYSSPQSNAKETAPDKPPRRRVRKPAPPPPVSRPSEQSITVETTAAHPPSQAVTASSVVEPSSPSGYDIKDIFFNGNIVYLLPLSDPLRLPIRACGSRLKGRGSFKNDCKFEVVFLSSAIGHELSVLVVMLKSFSQMNYYLAINQKGKIKMTKGAADKCKFVIRQVTERPLLRYGVVTLESAIHPGWSVAITSSGRTRNCKPDEVSARIDESRFAVRAERIFNPYSSRLMNFERISAVNQLRDRQVIQLQSKASSKYLYISMRGKIRETNIGADIAMKDYLIAYFVVFDRGMGVISLRNNKYSRLWLRMKESIIQGHTKSDLAADFRVTELPDKTLQFESIVTPGFYLTSPPALAQATSEAASASNDVIDEGEPIPNRHFTVKIISRAR